MSELMPNLLFGLPAIPMDQALLENAVGLGGIAPGACGRCRLVVLGSAAARRQHVLTIDERDRTIRRAQSFVAFRNETEGGALETVETERLVVYEPELDLQDEASLVDELRVPPW